MAKLQLRRFCCSNCGSPEVEVLDWVTINGDELVGGDPGNHYYCQGCDSHPPGVDERTIELELCGTCSAHRWGTSVPLPGVLVTAYGEIECCSDCKVYLSDYAAARDLQDAIEARGGLAKVGIVVAGVNADGWDESAVPLVLEPIGGAA